MKLKLDSKDAFTILSVSETIEPAQLPVLRAGVAKLLQGNRKNLVIDLTRAHPPSLEVPEVVTALRGLRDSASSTGNRVAVASNRAGLGDAATVDACIAWLTQPPASAGPEQALAELKRTLEALKAERAEAQKAIDAKRAESDEIRGFQKDGDRLKRLIKVLETELSNLMKSRSAPVDLPIDQNNELKAKLTDVNQVLDTLTQDLLGAGGRKAMSETAEVAQFQDEIEAVRKELRSIQGKLKNRDPELKKRLSEENTHLKARVDRLEKALFSLLLEVFQPKDLAEAKAKVEVLRLATVEHCKKTNIDTSLWKKIES